jgi:hypothetical protein
MFVAWLIPASQSFLLPRAYAQASVPSSQSQQSEGVVSTAGAHAARFGETSYPQVKGNEEGRQRYGFTTFSTVTAELMIRGSKSD